MLDMLTSGKNARRQPLVMIITTAGFDITNPCYRVEYDYVSRILDPDSPIQNDQYYIMICELDKGDDIKDERNWVKANPILGSYAEGVEGIREDLKEALDAPEKMRNFLTKNMNIWVDQKENGYMAMDKWAKCGVSEANPWPDVTGLPAIAGVDLSSTLDLTSVSFLISLPDGRKAVLSHSFIPEDTLAAKMATDNVRYDLWVEQGWITATPGASVDYNYVLNYMEDSYSKNKWTKGEVCFDRALATWLRYQLESNEYTPADIPQGMQTLSEPTKDFRAKVYDRKVVHNNNPVLTWAINNAVVREDHNGNIQLDKARSKERIDPVAALMNACVRGLVIEAEFVYSKRGMRSLL
jgi:phage terminase large subunit-like protein